MATAKHRPFGSMTDIVAALRERCIPIKALDLMFFTEGEEALIRSAYDLTYHEFARAIAPPPPPPRDDVERAIATVVSEIEEVA